MVLRLKNPPVGVNDQPTGPTGSTGPTSLVGKRRAVPGDAHLHIIHTSASPMEHPHQHKQGQGQGKGQEQEPDILQGHECGSDEALRPTTPLAAPAPAHAHSLAAGWRPWLAHELTVAGAELWEILQIKAFMCCVFGQVRHPL